MPGKATRGAPEPASAFWGKARRRMGPCPPICGIAPSPFKALSRTSCLSQYTVEPQPTTKKGKPANGLAAEAAVIPPPPTSFLMVLLTMDETLPPSYLPPSGCKIESSGFVCLFYVIISSGERRQFLTIDFSSQFEGCRDWVVSHAFRVTC